MVWAYVVLFTVFTSEVRSCRETGSGKQWGDVLRILVFEFTPVPAK